MTTTGYQAGAESNLVRMSYGPEANWSVKPGVAFKNIRLMSENLSSTKTRNRPAELDPTGQVSSAITTQLAAGGGINFALSYGTFDDFLASVLGGAWTADHLVAGSIFSSLYIQKQLANGLFLEYPGSLVTDMSLNFQQGQFAQGSATIAAQAELSATVDASTGAAVAAPGGSVIDTIGGFTALTWNGAAPASKVKNVQLTLKRQGAAAEYAVGTSTAVGMILGLLEASGTADFYFKTFDLYADFLAEAQHPLAFTVADKAGNSYAITLPQATLINPKIVAGGQNQSVMASFTIEGNPDATGANTIQVVRAAAGG